MDEKYIYIYVWMIVFFNFCGRERERESCGTKSFDPIFKYSENKIKGIFRMDFHVNKFR